MLGQVDVFWVVKVGIRGVEDGVDDTGLQVQQHSPRDVVFIICLQREQEDPDAAAAQCHFHCQGESHPLAAGEPHMAGPGEKEEGRREAGPVQPILNAASLCPRTLPVQEGGNSPCLHKTLSMAATASCLCSASAALH